MAKLKFNINIFDLLVVVAIAIVAIVGVISYSNKPFLGSKNVIVEVRISDVAAIKEALPSVKLASVVYYSGTKYPIKQMSYRTEQDSTDQIESLYITLEGPGDISEGNSIFNGQRIYVNQKVEIRADYQVQGYVADFRYEN
jgi:hypothetical protein